VTVGLDLTITAMVVVTVVLAIVGWVRAGRSRVEDALGVLSGRADRHEGRIAAIEAALAGLPGQDHIHAVQLSMAEVRGELREIRALMSGNTAVMQRLEAIVSRHEDHLLEARR